MKYVLFTLCVLVFSTRAYAQQDQCYELAETVNEESINCWKHDDWVRSVVFSQGRYMDSARK